MTFPNHLIDPRQKDDKWHLQFCQAAWDAAKGLKMFYPYAKTYEDIAAYVEGTENKSHYKKAAHIDEQSNQSAAVLDFEGPQFLRKYEQDCISYLAKNEFNLEAELIDAMARDERDQHFAELQAKMMLRKELEKVNPELAQAPQLRPKASEPLDEQELEMVKEYGYKSEMAKESEMAVEYIFLQNKLDEVRYPMEVNLVRNGVAVVKHWMESDGSIKLRLCDNRSIISNECRYADFRDREYMGEVVSLTWTQFAEMYTKEKATKGEGVTEAGLEDVFNKVKAKQGWRSSFTDKSKEDCKVPVLDIAFYSIDEQVYEDNVNRLGNPVFVKADYDNDKKAVYKKDRYKKVQYRNVYQAKWVVDTDIVFGFGRMPYQTLKNFSNAELPFVVRAINFNNMKATGITEAAIPIARQLKIAWLKIQNVLNSMPTHIVSIDVGALEEVNYSKGGTESMTPKELIEMFFQNGILLKRQDDIMNANAGYDTIKFLATNFGQTLAEAYNHFNNIRMMMMDAMGLNDVTIGNPNAKNLNSSNEAALQATSNALYQVAFAEEKLLLELAYAVLCRLKRAVKMGKVEGYVPALGTGTMEFFRLSPDISDRQFGLKLVNKPSAEEKQFLQTLMAKGMQEQTLDATDIIMVRRISNIKQAEEILAYRIKKRTEEKQQQALALQQQNGNIQIQSAQAAEKAKQETLQLEYALKKDLEVTLKQMEMEIRQMELGVKHKMNQDTIQSSEKQAGIAPTPEPTPVPDNEGAEGEMMGMDNLAA